MDPVNEALRTYAFPSQLSRVYKVFGVEEIEIISIQSIQKKVYLI